MGILQDILPAPLQMAVGSIVAFIGTAFQYLFGWNEALESLLWLMVLDYVSGVLAAWIRHELNSEAGWNGIKRKCMILIVIALAHFFDYATGAEMAQTVVVWFFFGNEGISILENAAKAGLPVPEKLRETLEQLTQDKKATRKDVEK